MNTMNTLHYGAAELKTGYNRNLGAALILAVVFHMMMIGLYLILRSDGPLRLTTPARPGLEVIYPPSVDIDKPVQEKTGGSTGGGEQVAVDSPGPIGSTEVAGATIVPVLHDSVAHPFATMGHMGSALPVFGTNPGTTNDSNISGNFGLPTTSNGNGGNTHTSDTDLDPEEFRDVQQLPTFDPAQLQRNLKYPELARRSGVEGTVVVRVLIDRQGNTVKTIIDASDNVMLEKAATDAVLSTTFTPALQNNLPTAVWMQVPVVFRLQ